MQILIVDDHAIVRAGLRQILAESEDPFDIHEAGSAREAMRALRAGGFELLLLDISLPDRNGLDLLRQVKRTWPDMPVLVLSVYPSDQYAIRALRAGAAGYMGKESAPDDLVEAIRKVAGGKRYITPEVAELLAVELDSGSAEEPHLRLSDREYQVLCLIGSGKTVSEIGAVLAISTKTVSTYRVRILEKMRMKGNAELMRYCVERRLV